MKQCPKCKANLEENARFCLFCMTSLDEKEKISAEKQNKWWLYALAALLAVAIIIGSLFMFLPRDDAHKASGASFGGQSESSDDTAPSESSPSSPEESPSSAIGSSEERSSSKASSGTPSDSTPSGDSDNGGSDNGGSSENTTPSVPSAPAAPNEDTEEKDNVTPDTAPSVVYLYRDATPADDFEVNSSVTNGGVVITGVETAASNGVYEIPETIGGKKVVAIMNAAFCDNSVKDTVKTVIIPKNVKTINAYAFYYCYNLTDIYIKGEAVACPSVILPEKSNRNFVVTVHASKTCHDRNFRTYKTLCELYWDAAFKEWNG